MTDTTLYLPERLKGYRPPPAGAWPRPKTGSQFGHLSLGERIFATPLLLHRLKQFHVPLPKLQPVYDRIVVYPLVSENTDGEGPKKGRKMANGVLYAPGQATDKLDAGRGLLARAGMGALEQLWSHGIEVGHIVLTARLSPWERRFETQDGTIREVMLLRASEVVGSEDLEDDIAEGLVDFEWGEDGRLRIKDTNRADPPENDEGI